MINSNIYVNLVFPPVIYEKIPRPFAFIKERMSKRHFLLCDLVNFMHGENCTVFCVKYVPALSPIKYTDL